MPSILHNSVIGLMKLSGSRHILEKEFRKNRVARQRPKPSQSARFAIEKTEFGGFPVWTIGADYSDDRIIYYGHGGGFITGMLHIYFEGLGRLSRAAGLKIIVPDYPMPPECPLTETRAWTLRHFRAVKSAYPEAKFLLAGDSAGANLVLGLTQSLPSAETKNIAALALLYPWLDLTRGRADYTLHWQEALLIPEGIREAALRAAGHLPLDDPTISPLLGRFNGLPPVHIFSGDKDMLFPDAVDAAQNAQAAGVLSQHDIAQGYGHDFWLFPTPDGRREIKRLAKIFADQLA